MFRVGSTHVPPPPGIPAPVLWGDEEIVRTRLQPYFDSIETTLIPIDFDMPVNPAGAVDFFRRYFGPTQTAFNRLDPAGQQAMHADLVNLWSSENVSPTPESHTLVPNQFLRVLGRRRA
jgi:hypothetical protein